MSGFVGVWNLDGAPVDPSFVTAMTKSMSFRGPDLQQTWIHRSIGLGCALFRTTFEAKHEVQPFTLNGELRVIADARIDARDELIDKLNGRGHAVAPGVADVELLARAYRVWGENCVEHLIGDFAFAIWDPARAKLFCARDHFGVKPFYYAHIGSTFLFSNTLNVLRSHPLVDDELNELAIADFLLFESNSDLCRTTFAKINRLPPAHALSISGAGTLRVERFWVLPNNEEIRYRKYSEYVDHFQHLFDAAVRDRLRTDQVSIPLSGGMDSSSVAATAKKVSAEDGISLEMNGHTFVYDRIIKDSERYYAGLVARHLRIPIRYQPLDDYRVFERWEQPGFCLPEPFHNPTDALVRDHFSNLASTARVALSGTGGDPAFCPSRQYLKKLLKSGRFFELVRASTYLSKTLKSLPPIGVRSLLRPEPVPWRPPYPDWLNSDFEDGLDLRERWNWFWSSSRTEEPRSEYRELLQWQGWAAEFERCDSGATRERIEFRYPFFDRRVVEFALRLPAVPWCVQKSLLRSAMSELLPREILVRRKKRLESNGMAERVQQIENGWHTWCKPAPELSNFVRLKNWRPRGNDLDYRLWRSLIPLSLNWWLFDYRGIKYEKREVADFCGAC